MTHDPAEKPKPTAPYRVSPLPRPARLPGITPRPGPSHAGNPDTIPSNHHRTDTVTDPQIICTNCGTEIKLTESLAAPMVAASRKQFEAQLAAKEADFGRREARLKQTQDDLAKAREAIDEQVAAKMRAERAAIAEAEAKKARLALADDLVSATGSLRNCSRCWPRTTRSSPKPSKPRPICCASSVSSKTPSARST